MIPPSNIVDPQSTTPTYQLADRREAITRGHPYTGGIEGRGHHTPTLGPLFVAARTHSRYPIPSIYLVICCVVYPTKVGVS